MVIFYLDKINAAFPLLASKRNKMVSLQQFQADLLNVFMQRWQSGAPILRFMP